MVKEDTNFAMPFASLPRTSSSAKALRKKRIEIEKCRKYYKIIVEYLISTF